MRKSWVVPIFVFTFLDRQQGAQCTTPSPFPDPAFFAWGGCVSNPEIWVRISAFPSCSLLQHPPLSVDGW